jgi:hypothetical protein
VNGGKHDALSINAHDEVHCASSGECAIHVTATVRQGARCGSIPMNLNYELQNDVGAGRHEVQHVVSNY